jgi:hypothetical protein
MQDADLELSRLKERERFEEARCRRLSHIRSYVDDDIVRDAKDRWLEAIADVCAYKKFGRES